MTKIGLISIKLSKNMSIKEMELLTGVPIKIASEPMIDEHGTEVDLLIIDNNEITRERS